ncbi:MAG: glycosyltransferase family 4 protein [Deltaproteobacteria bacterium]|nr:glycosyltransferase family 4 protein [Deltaproteobacteria bacterium]
MAGPAIRAFELASRLSAEHEVVLACPNASGIPPELVKARSRGRLTLVDHDGGSLQTALEGADVLVTQGFGFPAGDVRRLPETTRLVLDLYDPVQLELLARAGETPTTEQRLHLARVRWRLLWMLGRADHVLCASERQRAFWLGWLGAVGRLVPETLIDDPSAQRLLAEVPFGVPSEPPTPSVDAAKLLLGATGGEPPVLWWGGLWDWMDPLTAVRAIARLRSEGNPAWLVLPAGNRPGAEPMPMSARVEQEARRLGLWLKGVTRLPQWIPYAQRGSLLLSASAAVSCHLPSLEAELSFRTRLLDCLWAGVPVVATRGDELSLRAERDGWGRTVPPGDEVALANQLRVLLTPDGRARVGLAAAKAQKACTWDRSGQALQRLLEQPAPKRSAGSFQLLPELQGAGATDVIRTASMKVFRRLQGKK